MEIEIRAFIADIKQFEKRAYTLGAIFESEQHIIDYWLCSSDKDSFDQVAMHEEGSYGLRIRHSITDKGDLFELNCKVLETEGDHNAFHEHEVQVSDLEQCLKILQDIGLKVFCTVDKKRTTLRIGNCLINIEDIKGFRPAVELEIISDDNSEEHKLYMRNLLDQLGIHQKDRIEKSITYLYMQEFSFQG